MRKKCPLSGHDAGFKVVPENPNLQHVECEVCGTYVMSIQAIARIKAIDNPNRGREYILSGIARRRSDAGSPITILSNNMDDLLASIAPPSSPQDVLDWALIYIANRIEAFFESIMVDPNKDYPVAFAKDPAELEYTLREAAELGFLEKNAREIRLTSKGWERINDIRNRQVESNQAFVAMWFDPGLDPIWENGFRSALKQVGYDPLRIDEKQFNDKIDDQIVAEIRRSALLVADVTGHRAGVYFEAGFALGLGLPVIWTCRKDEIENAHFDTRQYNHIVWEDADDLKQRLVNRVQATLPTRANDV